MMMMMISKETTFTHTHITSIQIIEQILYKQLDNLISMHRKPETHHTSSSFRNLHAFRLCLYIIIMFTLSSPDLTKFYLEYLNIKTASIFGHY